MKLELSETSKLSTIPVSSIIYIDMIGKTGMVDSFNVSLSSSFGLFFLMNFELSETLKLSTIPVLPIVSLFNQFSTRSAIYWLVFVLFLPFDLIKAGATQTETALLKQIAGECVDLLDQNLGHFGPTFTF